MVLVVKSALAKHSSVWVLLYNLRSKVTCRHSLPHVHGPQAEARRYERGRQPGGLLQGGAGQEGRLRQAEGDGEGEGGGQGEGEEIDPRVAGISY